MRTISTDTIINTVGEMCIEANLQLQPDVKGQLAAARQSEESMLGQRILGQLVDNLSIAADEKIPICQDTGMTVVFLELGQDVHLEGMLLSDAVNEGIRRGYRDGYLRKSVVGDPLLRINTSDNTPGVIHTVIVPGDKLTITVAPKGFGSENMSRVVMLKPADGTDGVMNAVEETVKLAGPNACPPMVVGVGIGGTFELCALLAKKALTRSLNERNPLPHIRKLEELLLMRLNETGIGPGGLGGTTTCLGVNIETYATHIAGLPVGINICCHVNRHITRVL